MDITNLPPGHPYAPHQVPQGANPQAAALTPALNLPPQPTMAPNATNPSTTLFTQLRKNLESGVTVHHFEFYTRVKFSATLGRQSVEADRRGSNTTHTLILTWVLPSGKDLSDKAVKAHLVATAFEQVAKGITRTQYNYFVEYVFTNKGSDAMGCFLLNADKEGNGYIINLGHNYDTVAARAESMKETPQGWKTTPELKNMSQKLVRIYASSRIMKEGTVQTTRCTECLSKDTKTGGRVCRKVDGIKRCLWCFHLGRTCKLPGEGDDENKGDENKKGDGDDDLCKDNNDDDNKPKRKLSRKRSCKNPLKDFINDESIIDDNEHRPKSPSSRRSTKYKLDEFIVDVDIYDDEADNDNSSIAQPLKRRKSSKYNPRYQIGSDSDNETARKKLQKMLAHRTSRPSLGSCKTPDTTRQQKSSGSIKRKSSASGLRRPSTTATPTPDAAKFGRLEGNDDDDDERIGRTGKLLREGDAKKTYWQWGLVNGDPSQGLVKAPDMARSMSKLEFGPGRGHPEYKPMVASSYKVTQGMAGSLKSAKRKSAIAAPPTPAETPAEKEGDGGKEGVEKTCGGGDGAVGDEYERPRGGGDAWDDDNDELDKSNGEIDLDDDWASVEADEGLIWSEVWA